MKTGVKKVRLIYVIGIFLTFLIISLMIKYMSVVTIPIIFKVINYLIMGYGAYVSYTAFRASKRKAWLLICTFCLSIFFTLAVRTCIKTIFHEHYEKDTKTYMIDQNGTKIEHKVLTINFPIFQILLVIGLYYLAKDEIKKNSPRH